jgi:Zn-dependent membrane protease YugP
VGGCVAALPMAAVLKQCGFINWMDILLVLGVCVLAAAVLFIVAG